MSFTSSALRRRLLAAAAVATLATSLSACAGDAEGSSEDALVIYSGRNENLVAPLLDRLEEEVGVPVEVRYATSSELAAQLLEEGEGTEADVFFSQDAGALGALGKAGMLAPLDEATTSRTLERFRDAEGRWVPTSARARVVAYDPEQVPEVAQMTTIDDVLDPAYAGKVAYAPTNASFQSFVTALRVTKGEEGARQWLEAFAANDPQVYDNNIAILDAVDSGEVPLGLINHYYWFEKAAEVGEDEMQVQLHYLPGGDAGSLINVAGAGVIEGTDRADAAAAAVEFLVSDEAQQYFADTTAEYPVVEGVTTTEHDLVPLEQLAGSQVDLNDLDTLEDTLALLEEVGLS
jgi:iron(III) transport system substrate-binding protein